MYKCFYFKVIILDIFILLFLRIEVLQVDFFFRISRWRDQDFGELKECFSKVCDWNSDRIQGGFRYIGVIME